MASHQFAIAKASFSAGLLRPDPTSLSREAIADFHSLLNAAVQQCSPSNVQKCKQWVVQNVIQSTARFTALGKYLTALASSFTEAAKSQNNSSAKPEPSIKRKRVHILYILNDILYHAKYRIHDASISSKVQPILVDLITTTTSFKDCPKQQRKVLDLLDLWEEKGYYSSEYINKLRETARHASELGGLSSEATTDSGAGARDPTVKVTKAVPYVMPAFHGDSSTPWFDLPAGNLMPHIVPNSTRPINPELIKPLQLVAGPADESLALAVKSLLEDVDRIFGVEAEEDGVLADIDQLGQPIILDELTGDVVGGEGYYGWSRTFCERMKKRKKGILGPSEEEGRDRRSRSSSREPRKRRYSDSDDGSSRSDRGRRRRRRSYSSSRSPSTENDRRAPGLGRSRSPFAASHEAMNNLPQKPPSSSYPVPPPMFPQGMNPNFPPPPPPSQPPFSNQGPPYGNWVPPPPPPPLHNMQFKNGQQQQSGAWPPPPPPPPIPPPNMAPGGWQQQHQPQGRGYNGNNNQSGWQGRGGRGGYRGRGW